MMLKQDDVALGSDLRVQKTADGEGEDVLLEEAEDPLVASVRERIRRYNRRLFGAVLYCGLGTAAFALIAMTLAKSPPAGEPMKYIAPLAALVFGTIFAAILHPRKLLLDGRRDIEQVAAKQNVQVVGALTDMLNLEKEISVTHAQEGLIALLPRLRPEDAGLLNNRQRGVLRRVLSMNIELLLYREVTRIFAPISLENSANRRAVELRVAIMEALGQVGTAEDLPVLERWGAVEPDSEVQEVLRKAAERNLPLLRNRVAALSDRNTLLRASSSDMESTESLLRPALGTQDPVELLLRADEAPH